MLRVLAPIGLLLTTDCASVSPGDGRWMPLFDGRTLAGWTPKITGHMLGDDPRGTFGVKNGAIRVSYDRYEKFEGAFGHLVYRAPFTAYRVRFEYRFLGGGLSDIQPWQQSNSGIMLHGQPPRTMARNQQFPVSIEVQLLGAERAEPAPTGNLCTPGTQVAIEGRIVPEHCTHSSGPVVPNGRWVRAEVEVDRAGEVTHFIEGRQVLRYGGLRYDPSDADAKPLIARAGGLTTLRGGHIYLQSEGYPVEFRRIELRRLD